MMRLLNSGQSMFSKMEQNIWDNGRDKTDMARVYRYGKMEPSMKVIGALIRRMVMVLFGMYTVTNTQANGSMTKHTDLELISMQMVPSIRGIGKTIYSTVSARKSGQTAPSTRESMSRARSMKSVSPTSSSA